MKRRDHQVSLNIFDMIDSICREFRAEWKSGQNPSISEWYTKVPPAARTNLFQNLLETEVRFRRRQGDTPASAEYLKRYPEFSRQVRRVFDEETMMSMVDPMQDTPAIDSAEFASPGVSFDSLVHQQAAFSPIEMPAARRIGEYELLSELGRGGMGVVYEAKHLQRQNHVALKTLPTGVDGQEVNAERLHKFRNEFRSLSEINHPNLVGMQSLEVDGNQWFFTMDLINGVDFLSWVRPDDQLDESRLRSSLGQLVKGITALHRRGIVHRDLKPSNVLIEPDGRVAILDFGLVAEMQQVNDLSQTRSAMFAGTPKYAAPEQMYGQRSEASDWYAMGVMLFEALSGKVPFDGASPMEMLRLKEQEDPPTLVGSQGIAEDLASLTDGLLKREPPERWTTSTIAHVLQIDAETHEQASSATDGSHGSTGDGLVLTETDEEDIVLIGREKQLAELEEARQQLLQTGKPVVVWITGLSGEGKSSLAEKFLRPYRRGTEMLVLSGRCYDRESVPFKAIDSIIDPLVRFLRSVPDYAIESLLPGDIEMLAQLFPLLNRVRSISQRTSGGILSIDSKQIRFRGFEALRELLVTIGNKYPVALLIDDLQWGDADSAKALHALLLGNEPPPVLFLGAYRRDEMDESSFHRQWLESGSERQESEAEREISLQPLNQNQCIELIKARVGLTDDAAEDVVDRLLENTRGNPYFLDQIIEGFKAGATDWRPVPLDEIIAQKLGRLPSGSEQLLEYVAIAGKASPTQELAEISGSGASVLSLLTHMRSERLVRLVGSGEGQLVDTWHDKIRETTLERMETDTRCTLHRQFAEYIESSEGLNASMVNSYLDQPFTRQPAPEFSTARVYDLAYHFQLAGDDRALYYQFLAGELAFQSYASEEAIEYLDRAKNLFSGNESDRWKARLWYHLGTSSLRTMDSDKAIEQFEAGLPFAESGLEQAYFYSGVANLHSTLTNYEDATRFHDLALHAIKHNRLKGIWAYIASAINMTKLAVFPESWLRGTSQRTTEEEQLIQSIYRDSLQYLFERHIPVIEFPAAMLRCAVHSYKTNSIQAASELAVASAYAGTLGFPKLGTRHARRAVANIGSQTDIESEGIGRYALGTALSYSGDFTEATQQFEEAIPLLIKTGSHLHAALALHMWRHLQESIGPATVEIEAGKKLIDLTRSTQDMRSLCWGQYDLAASNARNGSMDEAIKMIEQSRETWQQFSFNLTTPIYLAQRSFVLLQASRYEDAEESADQSWRTAIKHLRLMDVCIRGLPWYLECVAGPNWSAKPIQMDRRLVRQRCRWARFMARFHIKIRPHLLRSRGRALTALGNVAKGTQNFKLAVSSARNLGMKYDLAKSLLDLAAVKEEGREENQANAIVLLKEMESVIPRAESWLLGDQYDEAVVAPEFDLAAWERENGPINPQTEDAV